MSLILSYDVTGFYDSIALLSRDLSGEVLLRKIYPVENPLKNSQNQSAYLIPRLTELLKEAGKDWSDLTTLCTLRGPGSFTGIRIGLASALGVQLALNCEIFAPTALELLLLYSEERLRCLAVIDSRRGDYFVQEELGKETFILDQAGLEKQLDAGYRLYTYHPLDIAHPHLVTVSQPTAELLIRVYQDLQPGKEAPLKGFSSLEPFYVRNPVFKKKSNKLPIAHE